MLLSVVASYRRYNRDPEKREAKRFLWDVNYSSQALYTVYRVLIDPVKSDFGEKEDPNDAE